VEDIKVNSLEKIALLKDMALDLKSLETMGDKEIYEVIDTAKDLAKSLAIYAIERDPEFIDQKGMVTHTCFNCGSNIFNIQVTFDDYEMGLMWPEGTCTGCDSVITVPAPWDHPNWDEEVKEISQPLPPLPE
jgi:hypothetical protein